MLWGRVQRRFEWRWQKMAKKTKENQNYDKYILKRKKTKTNPKREQHRPLAVSQSFTVLSMDPVAISEQSQLN